MAMAARPPTPPVQDFATRPYNSRANSFTASSGASIVAHGAVLDPTTPASYHRPEQLQHHQLHHNPRFHEHFDAASQRGSVVLEGPSAVPGASASSSGLPPRVQRSVSPMSYSRSATPSRSSTLKKRTSLSKRASMRRSGSRKSLRAGSVRSANLGEKYGADGIDDVNSAFAVPIPTSGNPTEALVNRFQAWRKILKDLVLFFKEIQRSYDMRSKLFLSASNVINNTSMPPSFLKTGGIADATEILRDFHRQGYLEANKAAEVENEVVNQLVGLRKDLEGKIKEIKKVAPHFRNSVDKEVDVTRRTIRNYSEALSLVDSDPEATAGRGDPFILRLSVENQIERQIIEENYLHNAYLNLENSGRELESIVVGEIQKAYNAYASVLKREADEAYDTVEKLRAGPIGMPQDHEWNSFVANTDDIVDPRIPLRNVDNIAYPGKDHLAAAEIRSGMLERKSKWLKNYSPGWYVLSPTHLHEFKSADRVASQTPVMSLYLPEQKLGSHSQPDSKSKKFMLKGQRAGTMHRGHSWVIRAETYETMMAWYEDIESLMSKTGEARNAFVRRHVRCISGHSFHSGSDDIEEEDKDDDEADRTPYSSQSAVMHSERPTSEPRQPGGRFPSDVHIDRHMQVPLSPSSAESSGDRDLLAAVGTSGRDRSLTPLGDDGRPSLSDRDASPARPVKADDGTSGAPLEKHDSYYGDWIGAAGARQQPQAYQAYEPYRAPHLQVDPGKQNYAFSDSNLLASTGSVLSQDPSGQRRARRESASTAPTTTNVTDYTNNTIATLPTSIDDTSIVGTSEFAGAHKNQTGDETLKEGPAALPSKARMSSASVAELATRNLSPGRPASNATGEDLKPAASGRTKSSVSTLELKIPGHYPPNVAAPS